MQHRFNFLEDDFVSVVCYGVPIVPLPLVPTA